MTQTMVQRRYAAWRKWKATQAGTNTHYIDCQWAHGMRQTCPCSCPSRRAFDAGVAYGEKYVSEILTETQLNTVRNELGSLKQQQLVIRCSLAGEPVPEYVRSQIARALVVTSNIVERLELTILGTTDFADS